MLEAAKENWLSSGPAINLWFMFDNEHLFYPY